MSTRDFVDVSLRNAAVEGLVVAPRIICSGPGITMTGGHVWRKCVQVDSPEEIRKAFDISARLALVDANQIAREEIGRVIANTTMLGAMIAATPIVPPERLEHALQERFGRIAQKNISAFRRAQKETVITEAV